MSWEQRGTQAVTAHRPVVAAAVKLLSWREKRPGLKSMSCGQLECRKPELEQLQSVHGVGYQQ